MDDRLDRIAADLGEIKVVIAKQEANLAEHMRRTALAEENIELLRGDVKPIQLHVAQVSFLMKIIGVVVSGTATLIGIAAAIYKLIGRS
jgi:hypothetical protein